MTVSLVGLTLLGAVKAILETSVFFGMMTAAAALSLLGLWGLVEVGKLGFYLYFSKTRVANAFK